MKKLTEIIEFLGLLEPVWMDVEFTQLAVDSRKVKPNTVFCACKGLGERHGNEFIADAIMRGATAVLLEQGLSLAQCSVPVYVVPALDARLGELAAYFYDYPSQQLSMIGVTGTNGKTSVSQYLAQALTYLQHRAAVIGTVGNGIWGQLEAATHTTPHACSLQALLHEFVKAKVSHVAMEVSSHGLSQNRVAEVSFEYAVYTNLSHDHLDYHGDMHSYAQAKAKLFAIASIKAAILNRDDAYVECMEQALSPKAKRYDYSLENTAAAVYLTKLEAQARGFDLSVHTPWGNATLHLPLLGLFNVSNALAVLTTLGAMGYALSDCVAALKHLEGAVGRMECWNAPQQPTVIIDYAHTPDALDKALTAARAHCHGKLWVVFGCGGNRDRKKRPIMGQIAARLADYIVLTEDNNRHEAIHAIMADILEGLQETDKVVMQAKRADAIAYALGHASKEDCILLAGKGHETYIEVAGQRQHFDEREVVKALWGQA